MSATLFLGIFAAVDGQAQEDLLTFVARDVPPPLWAGMIPNSLAEEHLARVAREHGHAPALLTRPDREELVPYPVDLGTGALVVPWTTARESFRDRLGRFAEAQPALAARASAWIDELDQAVSAIYADGADGGQPEAQIELYVEIDYAPLARGGTTDGGAPDSNGASGYLETLQAHLGPWIDHDHGTVPSHRTGGRFSVEMARGRLITDDGDESMDEAIARIAGTGGGGGLVARRVTARRLLVPAASRGVLVMGATIVVDLTRTHTDGDLIAIGVLYAIGELVVAWVRAPRLARRESQGRAA